MLKNPHPNETQPRGQEQVFHDASLTSPVSQMLTQDNHKEIVLPQLAAGTYYLRVTASHVQLHEPELQTYVLHWPGNTRHTGYHVLLDYLPR